MDPGETSVPPEDRLDEDLDDAVLGRYFGASFPVVRHFYQRLVDEGELRGLIGPRELPRLWSRHLINSASIVPYLPSKGRIADVGSGAGLPGIVIAAMLPDVAVTLIEPMERRCLWLQEISTDLGLTHVTILRGQAQEFHGVEEYDAVTSRAVARLDKLARWVVPLVKPGGHVVALKGRRASEEVEAARSVLRRLGCGEAEIIDAPSIPGVASTTVVRVPRLAGTPRK